MVNSLDGNLYGMTAVIGLSKEKILGRATKLIDTLQAGVKEYEATLALGSTTPSFDLETEVDATYPTAHITRTLVDEVIPTMG